MILMNGFWKQSLVKKRHEFLSLDIVTVYLFESTVENASINRKVYMQ
jgi:hypothetical protein